MNRRKSILLPGAAAGSCFFPFTITKFEVLGETLHPHRILAAVGTFGLLQTLLHDRFTDQVAWTDIFSDIALYDTGSVEVL